MVVAGIPCEGYSQAQTKKSEKFEAHPTGSLGFYVLKIIDIIRPAVVLIEEVPNFKSSAIAIMTRYVLDSMGYDISETELVGSDYGSLTKRKRYCMVASIKKGFEFNDNFKKANIRTVKDILEVPVEERVWLDKNNNATISYSLEKEKEHIRKGDGFRIGRTYLDDKVTPTITKGYYKNMKRKGRLSEPFLDRIDLYLVMNDSFNDNKNIVSSAELHESVLKAFRRQKARGQVELNGKLSDEDIKKYCLLADECKDILEKARVNYALSFRSINKILKVARTIADINGNELITKNDLLKSLNFRRR